MAGKVGETNIPPDRCVKYEDVEVLYVGYSDSKSFSNKGYICEMSLPFIV